ncbi:MULTISPECIES: glutathione S-transferase family protein [Pacificibacter]|uniref:glutathione S-transferase family protein n=1 Tax=Pacificibacter TaxID=1042323 RepID=UPI001C08660E|nr:MULTISPECIES: glutathione S-transferase family protein [Pacificibacter]MBU2935908.1 glutathione S-transferase family protein [Pacificibacter marinus]MDO6614403.1 glutathione S-transferase family protein [Pacificibacter sp. 1_MG-2023]
MTAQLYCFGESGNAYKAALTLTLCGIDWDPVYVDFFNGGARTPDYLAMNVMGEVPYLIDGDVKLSQSGVIQHYAVETSGKLGGKTPEDAREVMRWVLWDNQKMSGTAGGLRFLTNFLAPEKRSPDVIAFTTGRVMAALKVLDTALEGRDWLVGDDVTIADIACCGYLFYPEPFGFKRADWANIDRWLGHIEELPGWKHPYDMMPGSPADRA